MDIATSVLTFFGFLVALTTREAGKAYTAKTLGDVSAETTSRATFNPVPHIDILGTIVFPLVMLLSGIPLLLGWAKPVRFDPRYFKKAKRDLNFVYSAGTITNLGIAILCGIAIKLLDFSILEVKAGSDPIPRILYSIASGNLVIGIFNIIPIPNTDGWNLIMNNARYNFTKKMEQYSMQINLIILMLFLFGIFGPIFAIIFSIYDGIFLA